MKVVSSMDLQHKFKVEGSTVVRMGCITSKVVSKSMSFHKEMSHSLHKTDDIHVVEDVFTHSNGSNELLDQPSCYETINARDVRAGLEQQCVKKEGKHDQSLPSTLVVEKLDVYKAKRSKSCQCSPKKETPTGVPRDINKLAGNEIKWGSTNIVRSRSFHTVEEYDAMVENIQLVAEAIKGLGDMHDSATEVQLQHSKWSFKNSSHPDYYFSSVHEATQSLPRDEESIRENSKTDETGTSITSGPETREMLPSLNKSISTDKSRSFEDAAHEGSSISGKGLKRKSIAKTLESIQIPSTTEFRSVASLREWLHLGGQVYSPGTYITPKFGSYNLPNPRPRKECGEESIFDPNLVAAFEQCMQQLEAEEETILKQIEQVLEQDCPNDITEAKEESSSNTLVDHKSG